MLAVLDEIGKGRIADLTALAWHREHKFRA